MGYSFAYTRIKDTRTDADSPVTEQLMQDMTSNDAFNNALVRSNGTAIYTGAIDSDPTNATTSKVIDAGPTGGAIGNVLATMIYEVTSGSAIGVMGTINAIGAGSSRLSVNTNLYSQGMRSGDTYRVIYGNAADLAHTHSGIDSPLATGLTDTLEYEGGRSTGISNAGFTTVTFASAFTYPPVVAVTLEEGDSGTKCHIRNVTTTGFDVKSSSGTAHAVHWIAMTAGFWKTGSNLIYAGISTHITSEKRNVIFPRSFTKSPGMGGGCCINLDVNVDNNQAVIYGGATFNSTAGTNLNFATRNGIYYGLFTANGGDIHIIAITPTGDANNGTGTYTSGGASTIGSTAFEAGLVRASGATGTVTFSAAFPAAPAVVMVPVNTEALSSLVATHVNLTGNATTTTFPYRHSAATNGFAWIAMSRGHGSISATRI